MTFEPIAIVGQGCVLPGAQSPRALWDAVAAGKDLLTRAPAGAWRVDPDTVRATDTHQEDRTYSDRGGYVHDFTFDPRGYAISPEELAEHDRLVQWVLHAGQAALREAGIGPDATARAGLIIGNLSYPSQSLSELTEGAWLDWQGPSFIGGRSRSLAGVRTPTAANRFMSGLPAQLAARALGLRGLSFCLDAACASSLYAIALACDRLHRRDADFMLAGGVQAADDLFIHVGFSSLQALSPTGQSRPFHAAADGLVPAEGAAVLVLKRLADAVAAGDKVHGVIRGIGLANDGRGRGLLVPCAKGQERALRQAYDRSGVSPRDVSLVECHATGTQVGDLIEVETMAAVYAGHARLPVGSLKSNTGHLITVSGAAAIQKITHAFVAGTMPRTLHADTPLAALVDHPTLRVLQQNEPWTSDRPRIAGISNFGFGGNNAHLVLEEHTPETAVTPRTSVAFTAPRPPSIAIVGIEVRAGNGHGLADFAEDLFAGRTRVRRTDDIAEARAEGVDLPLMGLRFPPADLAEALPMQVFLLKAALDLLARTPGLKRDTTGVLIGMECDTAVAAYGSRLRMEHWSRRWATALGLSSPPAGWVQQAKDAVAILRGAAGVVGAMPNIPANRLSSQFDLAGPSFTVSAEELSGVVALDLAVAALQRGDMDAMVVGAVDMSCELAHRAAAETVLPDGRRITGDAAVVLVLEREETARAAGRTIYAVFDEKNSPTLTSEGFTAEIAEIAEEPSYSGAPEKLGPSAVSAVKSSKLDLRLTSESGGLTPQFGHAHAASGLLHVAAGALACHHRASPRGLGLRANPWAPPSPSTGTDVTVTVSSLGGATRTINLRAAPAGAPLAIGAPPHLELYRGADAAEVADRIQRHDQGGQGPACATLVGDPEDLEATRRDAPAKLRAARGPVLERAKGLYFYPTPIGGEQAFVFTAPAGSYQGMGRELLLAFPQLFAAMANERCLTDATSWIYETGAEVIPTPEQKLWGASFLSQLHAALGQRVLGLNPQAAIGFCSGESNSLFALGAWRDFSGMYDEIRDKGVFTREIGGEFRMLARAWPDVAPSDLSWVCWRAFAPESAVEKAIAPEPHVRLTIVNAPGDVIIGGPPAQIDRAVERIGRSRCMPIGYDVALHCAEAKSYEAPWWELHARQTYPVPGVRFYTASTGSHYQPTREACADAITRMSQQRVDFPRMIDNAYADGVRVFIEHGPRDGCAKWVGKILGDRPHVSVAYDRGGVSPIEQLIHTAAQLAAAGVAVDLDALKQHLATATHPAPPVAKGPTRHYPAHNPTARLPDMKAPVERGEPAPSFTNVRPMHRAPALPATRYEGALARMSVQTLAQPVAEAPTWVAPPEAEGQLPDLGAELVRLHAALAGAHQAFIDEQARAHQHAAGFFGQAVQTLLGATATDAQLEAPPIEVTPEPARPTVSLPIVPAVPAPNAQQPVPWVAIPTPKVAFATPAPKPESGFSPKGPTFSREDLEIHASGNISKIFGEQFSRQDTWQRQVRMPEKRLLLADRVVGIDAEPGSMKKGTVWTETEVPWDAWYLNYDGTMPSGLVVEAGQADLFLISYLGADFENEGKRVYRLLGCELIYEGGTARAGDTLQYKIDVTGHARVGKTRLFFFQYDGYINGQLRLKVRNGQAGFFTYDEMAQSGGVLWDAAEAGPATPDDKARVSAPAIATQPRSLTRDQVEAISRGEIWQALGKGWEYAASHTRTPRIQSGDMLLLQNVVAFDPKGGPWGRGYIRIENDLDPSAWYLDGHFKNDPCMPGTLMCEGCAQAMGLYLILMGYTTDKDGWIFQPVPGHGYEVKCRGQVSTTSKKLTYEIFVDEVIDGPYPTIFADILGTSDGLKIFHGRRVGLQLVPDWPLTTMPRLLEGYSEPAPERIVERVIDGKPFRYDFKSLLACAWGRPTDAFGPKAEIFCDTRHVARLPGHPYHFMSRVTRLDAEVGNTKQAYVEVEYDVPPNAWYFDENGNRTMPFCALLEIALQPCGWQSVYIGTPAGTDIDVYFRNLDGKGTVHAEVPPGTGTLLTKSRMKSFSNIKQVVLLSYDVEVWAGDLKVYSLSTGFGYFPLEAFAMQPGLPATAAERAWLTAPTDFRVDLRDRPTRYCGGDLRLAGPMLLMFDEVTGFWPEGGQKNLGKVRAEKAVRPDEWFFKAHFFQDPVQPGSLGCEALLQLLQWWMIHTNQHEGMPAPRFELIRTGDENVWKYRGQVVPRNQRITLELDVLEVGTDDRGRYARAQAWFWVDGLRIYSYTFGMRIVSSGADARPLPPHPGPGFFPSNFPQYEAAFTTWNANPHPMAFSATTARPDPTVREATVREATVRPDPTVREATVRPDPTVREATVREAPVRPGTSVRPEPTPVRPGTSVRPEPAPRVAGSRVEGRPWESAEQLLDAARDTWLNDHCPTYTHPSLPMMSVADRMAEAVLERALDLNPNAPAPTITGIENLRMTGWLNVDEPQRLKVRIVPTDDPSLLDVTLLTYRQAQTAELSRWEPKAEGRIRIGAAYPTPITPLPPLTVGEALPGPYETARIFHGPAFQLLTRWLVNDTGSTAWLKPESQTVPFGLLNQALLDNAVHGIIHDELWRWSSDIAKDQIAYPYKLHRLDLYGPPPTTNEAPEVRCETRFAGFDPKGKRFPKFHIQLIAGDRLWLDMEMVEVLMPVVEEARDRLRRIAFIRDKAFYEGVGACTFTDSTTSLDVGNLMKFSWLGKSMRTIYDINEPDDRDAIRHGVIKEHVSQRAQVHPYYIVVQEDPAGAVDGRRKGTAWSKQEPLRRHHFVSEEQNDTLYVREAAPSGMDFADLLETGRVIMGMDRWPGEDLFHGMMRQFVGRVVIEDPVANEALMGEPKLFLANHQVQVESPLVPFVLAPLTGSQITMIAKEEHRSGWIGVLDRMCREYPGMEQQPEVITYFDQSDRQSMFKIMEDLAEKVRTEKRSIFIHVEGELGLSCRKPVERMSSVFVDLAQRLRLPIVPVRFTGGLPVEPLATPLDFPVGCGAQSWFVGKPIPPSELEALPYAQRRQRVMAAINDLGGAAAWETPAIPDPELAARIAALRASGLSEPNAVMIAGFERLVAMGIEVTADTRAILHAVAAGEVQVTPDAKGRWMSKLVPWLFGARPVRMVS